MKPETEPLGQKEEAEVSTGRDCPFEQPTEELRQVLCHFSLYVPQHGIVQFPYYRVQRKWRVQCGPSKPINTWSSRVPAGWECVVAEAWDAFPLYAPVHDEWRDLPEVTEKEAALAATNLPPDSPTQTSTT